MHTVSIFLTAGPIESSAYLPLPTLCDQPCLRELANNISCGFPMRWGLVPADPIERGAARSELLRHTLAAPTARTGMCTRTASILPEGVLRSVCHADPGRDNPAAGRFARAPALKLFAVCNASAVRAPPA